ncbi:LuxR family transcriptional regulator [Mycolicibacter heraklionensis]|uniref:Probable hydrogen peroxide-inducible genes activator n=1 Tax=Mycolicibacter heraklionensis TaxID=512402 RepID=A0A9X7WGL8_9MYCO|nr:LysR family transcriptional regulator [Mycolicibacter heraklionensis]KLO30592.1 LuxR family transcriptional regulator [Mycolicibacter heraklionensis]QZA07019.1 LysR family transcriptional regulator [Mycolicibacter heraklionensis]
MELRQLKHFVAVAEELHFTRAAAKVHVVQSTLSASISSLEQELGTALLVRNNRRVDLTTAGLALLPDAQNALAAAEHARAAVDAVKGVLSGRLSIGVIQGLGAVDLPALLARYHRSFPRIEIAMRHDPIDTLVHATADGDLDLAFVSQPYDGSRVKGLSLGSEPLALAVRHDDPLADRDVVDLTDLRDREFVERRSDLRTRLHIDGICADLGFVRTVCAESNTPIDLVDLVAAGVGIAFLPPALVAKSDQLVGVATDPVIPRELALITPSERAPSPAAAAFLGELLAAGAGQGHTSQRREPSVV